MWAAHERANSERSENDGERSENAKYRENIDEEIGDRLRQLDIEAATFRNWLWKELPQKANSIGSRALMLAESSLVSALFLLFLQRRFAPLFRDIAPADGDHLQQPTKPSTSEAGSSANFLQISESLAKFRSMSAADEPQVAPPGAILSVAECCCKAVAALIPLVGLATQCKRCEVEPMGKIGKIKQRLFSAACSNANGSSATNEPPDSMEIVEYEPGAIPPLRMQYFKRSAGLGGKYEETRVCRFSRQGVALSPDIAIPVAVIFGEENALARTADFLSSEATRHLIEVQKMARSSEVRPCLPYLENDASLVARIHVDAGDTGHGVTLLALPTPAMEFSEDFPDTSSLQQMLEKSREESPAMNALLTAVDASWRAQGIVGSDYSFCTYSFSNGNERTPTVQRDEQAAKDELQSRRRVKRFLNQKTRWPLPDAEKILAALGIVIESKEDGAPHGKVRLGERHHTLSSKLLKDGEVYSKFLYEWIYTLGQDRLLADLLLQKDPRLTSYMRKVDAGQE